jgi:hypothetical protein
MHGGKRPGRDHQERSQLHDLRPALSSGGRHRGSTMRPPAPSDPRRKGGKR